MKENPNATLHDSNFGSKEIYPLNGDTLVFDEKERDKCWNSTFADDFSMDNQNRTRNSTEKEFQNGPFYPPSSPNEDADSLSSHTSPKPSGAEQKVPIFNENHLKDSNFYTDTKELECDTPELIVRYKGINYHVVKEICVDEGMPANSKISIGMSENERNFCSFRRPLDDNSRWEAKEGVVDKEKTFISDGLANSSIGHDLERPKSPSESTSGKDLLWKVDTNCGETDETLNDGSVEVCARDQNVSSGPKEDVQTNSLSNYNSNVESKSITFNFNSRNELDSDHNLSDSSQVHCNSSSKNTSIERVNNDFSSTNQAQCVSSKDTDHDQLLKVNNNNESIVSQEKYQQGESSFSAAGFITHSGPIPFSGSISFRSDGSATSGRSFAFPILQSEWNNSPVRMSKADGRHFRKHKCWRSGLLCCRF